MASEISKLVAEMSGKVKIYPLRNSIMGTINQILIWNGDDPSKFLETMNAENVSILYHYISPDSTESEDHVPEHEEIAFLANGFMHLFVRSSGIRATEKAPEHEQHQDPGQSFVAITERKPEDVAADMTNFVSMNLDYMSPDTFNLQYFFKKYWQSQGLNPDIPAGSSLRKFMDKVEEISTRKIKSRS
ncbi:MAG: hypothetical protein QXN26_06350 [Thermoplasmataceae archaeon]